MQNKEIITKKIYMFIITFFIIYMAYAMCLNWSFTGDQVNSWNMSNGKTSIPSIDAIVAFFSGGRFALSITEVFRWFLSLFGINIYWNQIALKFLIIFSVSYAVCSIYELILPFFHFAYKKEVVFISIIIAFVNPYFVELFTYSGFEWAISLILVIISVKLFAKKRYFFSAVVILFAISIYQSYFEIFLIIISSWLYLQYAGKLNKKFCIEYIKMLLVAGGPAVFNIFIMKIFIWLYNIVGKTGVSQNPMSLSEVKKVSLSASFLERIYSVCIVYYEAVCTSFGMFPKGMLLVILCLLVLSTLIMMLSQHMKWKDIAFFLLENILIQLFSVALYFVAVGTGATAGRVIWIVFLAIGMTAMISFYHLQNCKLRNYLWILMTAFLIIDVYSTETAAMDFYIANKLDMQEAIQIQAEIDHYEKKTGNQIKKIAVRYLDGYENRDCSPLLSKKYLMGTYHNTTFHKSWANVELINFINKKHYEKEEMPEEIYEKNFEGQTWTTFMPDKQIVFHGDTAYWGIY